MTHRIVPSLALCALLLGCSSVDEPIRLRLEIVSGDGQTGEVGTVGAEPLVVRVTEESGTPAVGVDVAWRVIEGGAGLTPSVTTTGADGTALAEVVFGRASGTVLILAEARDQGVRFQLSVRRSWRAASAGWAHSCALSSLGEAYCWGANSRSQLGDGSEIDRPSPVSVFGGSEFDDLAVGWRHTCGLDKAGTVLCWGDNSRGQLGVGEGFLKQRPTVVPLSEPVIALSAGYLHTCAVTESGAAYCWGSNAQEALGATAPDSCDGEPCARTPQRVTWEAPFRTIAAGEFHTCAIEQGGAAMCWGWNSSGELGTGEAPGSVHAVPQRVTGGHTFDRILAHARHTCASTAAGKAWCWGRNARGELGDAQYAWGPIALAPELSVASLSTGNLYTCLVLSGGGAACFGDQADQVTSTTARTFRPPDFSQVGVGHSHTCGVADGDVWCWGANNALQVTPDAGVAFYVDPVAVTFPG